MWIPRGRIHRSSSTAPVPIPARSTTSSKQSWARKGRCGPISRRARTTTSWSRVVAGDPASLGFFGFAYYAENKDRLNLVSVDGGNGAVAPSEPTINDGTYAPLSRPLFIYVRKDALDNPAVLQFVEFYLQHSPALSAEVGYVALPEIARTYAKKRLDSRAGGSLYDGGKSEGSLLELIAKNK